MHRFRYMINAMLGGDANGIYTVANKLPTILTLLSSVLMQAWQFSAIQESRERSAGAGAFLFQCLAGADGGAVYCFECDDCLCKAGDPAPGQ
ncbi:MAG: hypothetical protein V8S89_07050 [Oscillospiraceae bacterium]